MAARTVATQQLLHSQDSTSARELSASTRDVTAAPSFNERECSEGRSWHAGSVFVIETRIEKAALDINEQVQLGQHRNDEGSFKRQQPWVFGHVLLHLHGVETPLTYEYCLIADLGTIRAVRRSVSAVLVEDPGGLLRRTSNMWRTSRHARAFGSNSDPADQRRRVPDAVDLLKNDSGPRNRN
ncbi:hypothetical protein AJ78_01238 [Emergomyces pasteurianus Ep9510]|uniref:Uncharacterized protein n=1 Tax=Emergomyces pasteurianus Ep9510 TaxID=1447872 RepID=A0A1J9QRF8_9EURO|nr:hypothetical protein AJ78_01238 [Emergomyces pasteurianus Ep9510]